VITRTYKVTDACDNFSTVTQTITIDDETPPVIIVPVDISINCDEDPITDKTGTATATDNCGTPTITFVDNSTTADGCGNRVITRTWTATDACGNKSSADQIITIDDCINFVLYKTTNGQSTYGNGEIPWNWTFTMTWIDSDGNPQSRTDATTPTDGVLFDNLEPLSASHQYKICEWVPAGWSSIWQVGYGTNLVQIPTVPPAIDPLSDNSTVCATFVPKDYGPSTSCDFTVLVDNSHPGGEPRTPGYWKNWSSITNGNQLPMLDDALAIGGGIKMYSDIPDCETPEWIISDVYDAYYLLDARNITGNNKKSASDAAYTLMRALLAYKLNIRAGAGTCNGAIQAALDAEALLCSIGFDGTGTNYLRPKDGEDYTEALRLNGILDLFNNNSYCDFQSGEPVRMADSSEVNSEMLDEILDSTTDIMITAYPNPFDQEATIEFSVPYDSHVSLDVYSLDGRHVTNLYRDDVYAHERYSTVFDATFLPSNVYIYKLTTDQGMRYGKLMPHNR